MKIAIDQIITRAKMRLKLTNTTMPNAYLELLINEGARHLDNLNTFAITCATLSIDCEDKPVAHLPDNYQELLCFKFPGNSCCGCCDEDTTVTDDIIPRPTNKCLCTNLFVASREMVTNFCDRGQNAVMWNYANMFEVQNGLLYLPTTTTATEVKIWYRGTNVDEDGIMILDEDQERGLSAYAAYQYALDNKERYDKFQIQEWKKEWIAQKDWLKGSAVKQDHTMHKWNVTAISNAIFLDPWLSADRYGE